MVRVLIVDDHAVVRSGLVQMLTGAGFEVVGAAADGQSAIEAVKVCAADVVLMDLSMAGMDGAEATRRIRALQPELPVVALTSFSDRERILDAVDAGVTGYLLKDDEPDALLGGIEAAARGESPISPKAAGVLLDARAQRRSDEALTGRERDVLTLVSQGLTNKQIADRRSISQKTVKSHLTKVFQRIGVSDRTQAALWAQRNRLV